MGPPAPYAGSRPGVRAQLRARLEPRAIPLGCHDDCGDDKGGATIELGEDWQRHRYLVEFAGGRHDARARATARLGWALAVACPGTPMLFMGTEFHQPGYWHDGDDRFGDHRPDWSLSEDGIGREMRRFVGDANRVRRERASLRGDTFAITHDDPGARVLAFKRWVPGGHDVVLAVANFSDRDHAAAGHGVYTGGQAGRWLELLNTQARIRRLARGGECRARVGDAGRRSRAHHPGAVEPGAAGADVGRRGEPSLR